MSRRTFDKVCADYQEALRRQVREISDLETILTGCNNAFRHVSDRCHTLNTERDAFAVAKNIAETERDALRHRLEAEQSLSALWRSTALGTAEKNSRLHRQRELLLDVMTAAEDAGTDFSSVARGAYPAASGPVDSTAEYKVAG